MPEGTTGSSKLEKANVIIMKPNPSISEFLDMAKLSFCNNKINRERSGIQEKLKLVIGGDNKQTKGSNNNDHPFYWDGIDRCWF